MFDIYLTDGTGQGFTVTFQPDAGPSLDVYIAPLLIIWYQDDLG